MFITSIGVPRPEPITPDKEPKRFVPPAKEMYKFFLEAGSNKELKDKYIGTNIKFFNGMYRHPNYDQFSKDRNLLL